MRSLVIGRTAEFGCEQLHRALPWNQQSHRSVHNESADSETSVQELSCKGREVI